MRYLTIPNVSVLRLKFIRNVDNMTIKCIELQRFSNYMHIAHMNIVICPVKKKNSK